MGEKSEKIVYTLRDKFLSLENEKRITGGQLFSRTFTPWLLMVLLSMFLIFPILWSILWMLEFILYMPIISMLMYYWIILWLVPRLIIKRCHDFNDNWIITKNIFLWFFCTLIVANLSLVLFLITELSFLDNIIGIAMILKLIWTLWIIILWLYLLFRPWTKWKNDYWDDTTNIQIWLIW